MKQYLSIVCILATIPLLAQKKGDTTFIDQETFILNNRSSAVYEKMADIKVDKRGYKYAAGEARAALKHNINKHDLLGLPHTWRKMVAYQGKYYPYMNEEFGGLLYMINDSAVVYFFYDGPYVQPIKMITRKGNDVYRLITGPTDKMTDTTLIYIVDHANGIAVFDSRGDTTLMIDTKKIKNFPVIISWNTDCKTADYQGEKINYSKLLENISITE